MTEREFAIAVVRRLREAGYQAFWAGGCVRDEMLGLHPKDYDVATDARPEEVQRLFPRTVAVGMSFGVVEVLERGDRRRDGPRFPLRVQVATFRTDLSYTDGRHPDAVEFATAREDALRRDFTINGMFFDPIENRVLDFVGGQEDLQAKVLRAIGDPRTRFAEDKLRMLRAVRIAARYGLTIQSETFSAIQAMAEEIRVVSAERIADELRKLLVDGRRTRGVALLDDAGLLAVLLPEATAMHGLPQGMPDAPTGDLWQHVLTVLDELGPAVSFPLAFAALLHDVGKPRTIARTAERYTFYLHEHVGARMASDIAQRLRLSNAERERIAWLVEKHQYLCDARQMRTSKLKMILAHPGIQELLALHRADAAASGRSTDHADYCERLLEQWSAEELNPAPLLTGHDLARRGVTPGPAYKQLLTELREAQLDGTVRTLPQAWELVDRLLDRQGEQGHWNEK